MAELLPTPKKLRAIYDAACQRGIWISGRDDIHGSDVASQLRDAANRMQQGHWVCGFATQSEKQSFLDPIRAAGFVVNTGFFAHPSERNFAARECASLSSLAALHSRSMTYVYWGGRNGN